MESGRAPVESGGAPIEFGGAPIESGGAPMESGGAPMESGRAPMEFTGLCTFVSLNFTFDPPRGNKIWKVTLIHSSWDNSQAPDTRLAVRSHKVGAGTGLVYLTLKSWSYYPMLGINWTPKELFIWGPLGSLPMTREAP